jgi:hypothetical protein
LEVTDGRNSLESSLYSRKTTAADDGLQRMNLTLIPNIVNEGRQAEQALASSSMVEVLVSGLMLREDQI